MKLRGKKRTTAPFNGPRPMSRPSEPRSRNGPLLSDMPRQPQRWREVLLALLDFHNWAHATLCKGVSFATMEERRHFLFAFFRELRGLGYLIDPRSLGTRHLEVMVAAWLARDLSAATVQRYLSHVRLFCEWIGKPGMVPELSKLTPTPEKFARSYVAVESKSWDDKQVDADAVIARADQLDRYVGAQLRMQKAFGLRAKESLLLQPNLCVVEVEGQPHLLVQRGTKGGRTRHVAVNTDEKRAALAHAKALVLGLEQSLADPKLSLLRAYRRFYHVMSKLGVTRSQLGVTAHGLRHGFAADEYEVASGHPAPVKGGAAVDRATDFLARLGVAEQLGHSRAQIASAYLGGTASALKRQKNPSDD